MSRIKQGSSTKVGIFITSGVDHITGVDDMTNSYAYGYASGNIFESATPSRTFIAVANDVGADGNDIEFFFDETQSAVDVSVLGTVITVEFDADVSTYGEIITALLASAPVLALVNFPGWVAADSADATVVTGGGEA